MSPARFRLARFAAFALIGLAIILSAVAMTGCGKSALDNATSTQETLLVAQHGVVQVLRANIESDLNERCGDIYAEAARIECATERAAQWADAENIMAGTADSLDALTLVLRAWTARVVAGLSDAENPPLPVCEALSQMTAVVESWTRVAGESIPIQPWQCPEVSP